MQDILLFIDSIVHSYTSDRSKAVLKIRPTAHGKTNKVLFNDVPIATVVYSDNDGVMVVVGNYLDKGILYTEENKHYIKNKILAALMLKATGTIVLAGGYASLKVDEAKKEVCFVWGKIDFTLEDLRLVRDVQENASLQQYIRVHSDITLLKSRDTIKLIIDIIHQAQQLYNETQEE